MGNKHYLHEIIGGQHYVGVMDTDDWKFVEGSCPTADTDNPVPDVPPLPKEILSAPPLKDDEPVLGRQYTVSREEAEAQLKEDEGGHTFIKVSHQDYATCEDCGSRVQFYNNPTAHAEMMAHKCEEAQLGNGIDR